MSHEILQSTKVFEITDGTNTVFINGFVSESSNVSPKRFDTISFRYASLNKQDLLAKVIDYVEHMMQGCIQLKDRSSKEDSVDTFVRRYQKNIEKAKVIHVELISITKASGKIYIVFGEQGIKELKSHEPTFGFYDSQLNGTSGFMPVDVDDSYFKALDFVLNPKARTIENALEISKNFSYIPALVKDGNASEEQFFQLIKNTSSWVHGRILKNTTTRLSEEKINELSKEEKEKIFDGYHIKNYMNKTM